MNRSTKNPSRQINIHPQQRNQCTDSSIPLKFFLLTVFLLVAAGFSIYANILHAPFLYDDVVFWNNPEVHVSNPLQIWDIIKDPDSWRRVGTATFALNFSIGGIKPFGYHLFNLFIHVINALLLFSLTRKTLTLPPVPDKIRENAPLIAMLGSLIWLVHPVQIMAVTYTVQRFTSLAAMFFLLSLLLYVLGRINLSRRRYLFFALSCISGLLALGSKENAAMLPFVILLYELFFFSETWTVARRTRTLLWLLGLLAFGLTIVLTYVGPDFWTKITRGSMNRGWTPYERVITEWRVMVLYVSLLILPHPSRLNVDYDFPISKGLFTPPSTALSLLFLILVLGVCLYHVRRKRLLSFAIVWFFVNLIVESTVYPLDLVYEHRLYLPSMGPIMLFAGFLCTLKPRQMRTIGIAFGFFAVVLFSCWTYQRNLVWKSPITLWEDNVKKSPNKARVHGNLGKAYLDNREYEKARREFEKVIALDPRLLGAYDNLAVIYIDHYKNYGKAEAYLKEAIRRKADFPSPYLNLGVIHLRLRQLPEAISLFEKVLELNPNHLMGHYNLAACYFNLEDYQRAISILEKGISLWPKSSKLYGLLGAAYFHKGEKNDAEKALRKAIELDPDNGMAIHYLKEIQLSSGR